MKRIQAVGTEPFVEGPLDLVSKPAFAKRGMHFNGWPFNYPYSFRRWKEEDWNRFVDILAYDGVNLFYLWPFIEIMPVPSLQGGRGLSAGMSPCDRVRSRSGTAWKCGSCNAPTESPRTTAA